jgi:phosphoenolpyruvate synthase/pyruvate phosphate dikinase
MCKKILKHSKESSGKLPIKRFALRSGLDNFTGYPTAALIGIEKSPPTLPTDRTAKIRYHGRVMSTPALLLLSEFIDAEKSQLGSLGSQYASLHRQHVPLPQMLAIPRDTLHQIATANNLLQKVEKLAKLRPSTTEFSEKLHRLIARQQLPDSLATDLARKYHGYCKQGFVTLFASPLVPGAPLLIDENLKGEATVQEGVLELWARCVTDSKTLTSRSAPTLDKLIPAAILIQRQPDATVSGTGFTRHPLTGDRSTLLIQSAWGCHTSPLPTGEGDSFEVDARTYHLLRKNIRTQTTHRKLTLGGAELKPLPKEHAGKPTLSTKQVERIARLLFHLKQKSLHHYRITWALEQETLYCLRLTELNPVSTHPTISMRTSTKLFASIHNHASLTPETISQLDGALLRLEYSYAKFGMHPLAALQNNYHRLLRKELLAVLTKTTEQLGNLPLLIRSQNFTSTELKELTHSRGFEPDEPNSYLGLRGGLKALLQPEWLAFELSLIAELRERTQTPIHLLLPFIRTPAELARLTRTVNQTLATDPKSPLLWLELSTPASVFTLAEFPLESVAGVVLNCSPLHALMHGFDPTNQEVASYYPPSLASFELLLKHTLAGLSQAALAQNLVKLPLVRVQLDTYNPQFVELATQYAVEGIIAHPRVAQLAKSSIVEVEARPTHAPAAVATRE